MNKYVTSRDLARDMRKMADALDGCPEFETDSDTQNIWFFYYEKEPFINFAKAVSSLGIKKEYTEDELRLEVNVGCLDMTATIKRKKVCRLVEEAKPAVYECDPLLAPEEEAAL